MDCILRRWEFFALNDEEIARRTIEEMRRFFPAMPQSALFALVYRWPEAICLASGGMRELFLAGDYTRLLSLNGAMKSGMEAAKVSLSYVALANA